MSIGDAWAELRDHLVLRIEPFAADGRGSQMEVRFVVENTWPASDDGLRVVFHDVSIEVTSARHSHEVAAGTLEPATTFTHTEMCEYVDLPSVRGRVRGRVDADVLLTVSRSARPTGGEMPWAGFLSAVDQMAIGEPIRFMRSVPIPGPDSTLRQVKDIEESFRERLRWGHMTRTRIEELYNLTEAPAAARGRLTEFHGLLLRYFEDLERVSNQMVGSLPPTDERQFEGMVALQAGRLAKQLESIGQAANKLRS